MFGGGRKRRKVIEGSLDLSWIQGVGIWKQSLETSKEAGKKIPLQNTQAPWGATGENCEKTQVRGKNIWCKMSQGALHSSSIPGCWLHFRSLKRLALELLWLKIGMGQMERLDGICPPLCTIQIKTAWQDSRSSPGFLESLEESSPTTDNPLILTEVTSAEGRDASV